MAFLVGFLSPNGFAASATKPYVITNDDSAFPAPSGVGFYSIAPSGRLNLKEEVTTGGFGIAGGFFGANRIVVLDSNSQQCVYASDALTGDIVGISISTLTLVGSATGSETDTGTSNGIGLAMNEHYLYASFTDSNTIGTFQVQAGCGLTFIADLPVAGLQGGIVNGMGVHGNMLIATYSDGSIESFDITAGTPLSHGDKLLSTAAQNSQGATYPNSIDITSDGHYAIFGDTSTSVVVEVSDISSGKLTPTAVHKTTDSISSSNIILSPDETLLYVVNTQGATVSALFFDKNTGKLSGGCTSDPIKGQSAKWSYLAGASLISNSGNGGGVYVAEFGGESRIATVTLTLSGRKCSFQEAPKSPILDNNSSGLLSIGTFPPRSF
jgi:6-phosphogluconolactonase (cycloisomerase 2 family)